MHTIHWTTLFTLLIITRTLIQTQWHEDKFDLVGALITLKLYIAQRLKLERDYHKRTLSIRLCALQNGIIVRETTAGLFISLGAFTFLSMLHWIFKH